MAQDIIAAKPEFVLQVGDISDSSGGPDSDRAAADADDPDLQAPKYPYPFLSLEWSCVRENFFDLLEAAGLPVFMVTGNHDSCVEFERWFPVAAFRKKPWYYADQSRPKACGVTHVTDTEQRAALFQTKSVGPICVVGADFDTGDPVDDAWVNSAIGCGAHHPTILLRHYNVAAFTTAEHDEIFQGIYGHVTPPPGGSAFNMGLVPGGGRKYQYAITFLNWQERSLGRGYRGPLGKTDDEKLMHTGLGWWVLLELDPAASTLSGNAQSPLFPGEHRSHDPSQYRNDNGVLTFEPSWCSRFPSSPACPGSSAR